MYQYKLSEYNSIFKNTRFDNFNGIGISYLLMSTMSCQWFSREQQSLVILLCLSSVVSYHISKSFVAVEKKDIFLDKAIINIKKKINAVDKHDNYLILT